ncbi:hypothetical protein SNEBB_009796, partial [Seison nebaliae]
MIQEPVEVCKIFDDKSYVVNAVEGVCVQEGAVLVLYKFGEEMCWYEWNDGFGADLLLIRYIFKRINLTFKVNGKLGGVSLNRSGGCGIDIEQCVRDMGLYLHGKMKTFPQELECVADRALYEGASFVRLNQGDKVLYIWSTGLGRYHVNAVWRDAEELFIFEPIGEIKKLKGMINRYVE